MNYFKTIYVNSFHFYIMKSFVIEDKNKNDKELLIKNKNAFKSAFVKYLEFLLLKRTLYFEPDSKCTAQIKFKQIISLLYDNHENSIVSNSNQKEIARFLNSKTNQAKESKNSITNVASKTFSYFANLIEEDNNVKEEKTTEEYGSEFDISKIILFCLNFSIPEITHIFMNFLKKFDRNLDFKFDLIEFINIIGFATMTSLANNKVSEIMKLKGVKVRPGKYSVLEGTDQHLSFEKSAYLKLYEGLSDPELKAVTFDSFLPFLFLFFISKI